MAEFEKILFEFFTGDGMTIARTVAVFIFGLLAVKLILLIVNKLSVRAHIDKTISSFVLSVVGVLLYFGCRACDIPCAQRQFKQPCKRIYYSRKQAFRRGRLRCGKRR